MSKLICEYGNQNQDGIVLCSLIDDNVCKYITYCTQDSKYWCSSRYYNCERRKSKMAKRDRKNNYVGKNKTEEIIDNNVDKIETIVETPIQEEQKQDDISVESKKTVSKISFFKNKVIY